MVSVISSFLFVLRLVAALTSPQAPQRSFVVSEPRCCDRRAALAVGGSLLTASGGSRTAWARQPGSSNVPDAVLQIRDAATALTVLQRDWDQYAVINAEGRAGNNTEAARRILGGVKPQGGVAALEYAQETPLYRLDKAFVAIRNAALNDDAAWAAQLDLERFEELADRIVFAVQKVDSDFYSVLFAAKGSSMLSNIYKGARGQVDQGVLDLREMLQLLQEAGAPGL